MTDLPHDLYIEAVVQALTLAELEPDDTWTAGDESNRYRTGCGTQLDATLVWSGDNPRVNRETYPDGLLLLWEHPAEQWQWAPRRHHGVLDHAPDAVPTLPRWADPTTVVHAVRELLAGRPTPDEPGRLWQLHQHAQAAVDRWEAHRA